MGACEFFTFSEDCDIPNWLTLVIEGIIGASIAGFFYWFQIRKSKKREKYALKQISANLIDLEDFNTHLQESINNFYDKKGDAKNFWHNLDLTKVPVNDLKSIITVYSQDLDEDLLDEIDFLIFGVNDKLPFLKNMWRDSGHVESVNEQISLIKNLIERRNPKFIHDARRERTEKINELIDVNKKFKKILDEKGHIDPKKIPKISKVVDNKGTYWFE